MILPVYGYGQKILRKKAKNLKPDFPELNQLIENMWDTLYASKGVGLAAPQVGISKRLFLVDTEQTFEEEEMDKGICKVFINAEMLFQEGDFWSYEEGCLSIPNIRAKVDRQSKITIRYFDQDFKEHTQSFEGINARVIQHEYDHIEGILFTDHLKPLKKRLLKRRLEKIKKGKVEADYPMKFFAVK